MSLSTSPFTDVRAQSFVVTNRAVVVLVSALFFIPSTLFAMSLEPLPAIAVVAGCCGAMALIVGRGANDVGPLGETVQVPRLLIAIGLALVILLLGGETHLFFATSDWEIRDAVLSDLVRHGLTAYRIADTDYLLRAPLGMYMTPALVGRAFGLFAAHVALLAQNALILGSIFYLMTVIGRGWANLAIVILFAGLSIVGAAFLAARTLHDVPFLLEYGLDAWHPYLQYSSSIVQLFWVPNHALPGWWLAVLLLLQRRSSPDVATVGVSVAIMAFWSPLAVIPFVAWLLLVLARGWRQVLTSRRTWLGAMASAGFLPILAYMLLAASTIAHGTLADHPDVAFWYQLFVYIQLPALLFLAVVWREIPEDLRALVVVNGLFLLLLPLVHFGPNNDLVMRGSIAPLTIVAFVFGWVVVELTRQRRIAGFVGCALIVATTPSAALEIGRSLSTPRYAISDCSLMEASQATGSNGVPSNYVAPVQAIPKWLLDARAIPFAPSTKEACWPDRLAPRYFGLKFAPKT